MYCMIAHICVNVHMIIHETHIICHIGAIVGHCWILKAMYCILLSIDVYENDIGEQFKQLLSELDGFVFVNVVFAQLNAVNHALHCRANGHANKWCHQMPSFTAFSTIFTTV